MSGRLVEGPRGGPSSRLIAAAFCASSRVTGETAGVSFIATDQKSVFIRSMLPGTPSE